MANENDILAEQNFVSDRISTQVRTIALSLIAVAWLFLSGGGNLETITSVKPTGGLLFACLLLSMLALALDYFQYLAGYISTRQTLDKGPSSTGEYSYNYHSNAYIARYVMFVGKQIALVTALLLFTIAMLKPLW